jgi:hypothetical protein
MQGVAFFMNAQQNFLAAETPYFALFVQFEPG